MNKFDSIIFDMDGTLWDAVDSYCRIWDVTFEQMGISADKVERQVLLECMGLPIDEIFRRIVNIDVDAEQYLRLLDENEKKMMPMLGGILYPGVADGIPQLAQRYRLFMVSNCGAEGLTNFLAYTGLAPYFEGTLSYGETLCPKADNIKSVVNKYALQSPVYVGDTQGDCNSAHKAGVPMMFASYGFGTCTDAEYSASDFNNLVSHFLSE
ncbi:MAG: HAD family hydrolase [Muribaculaceae bacterium]|nr:HAD family hydrolase [Muribaculaceae bacterium]